MKEGLRKGQKMWQESQKRPKKMKKRVNKDIKREKYEKSGRTGPNRGIKKRLWKGDKGSQKTYKKGTEE